MTLLPLDFVFIAIILLITVLVTVRGFIAEFFSKAAVIIGAAGAILFFGKLSPFVAKLVSGKTFPDVIAFLLLFLVLYLFVKVIQRLAGSVFETETMTNLDRALGFFFGRCGRNSCRRNNTDSIARAALVRDIFVHK